MPERQFRIVILLFIIAVFFAFSSAVTAVQVNPMVININTVPGNTESFELALTSGPTRETVAISIMHPVQHITGRLSYQEGNPEINPAINWVSLDRTNITLPANERTVINGTVNIPFNAGGTHTVILMVDQLDLMERPGSPVGFRIRYAVRLNINIDRPGQRPAVDIFDFSLQPNEKGNPVISTHFKNISDLHFPAVADVTIRDENRRLIERVPVYSEATSLTRRDNFRVYPGSELIYQGEVTEPLFPGSYEIQLFFRYADGRQVIRRETLELGSEYLREDSIRYLTVDPAKIALSLRPGASSTQVIQLDNRFSEPVYISSKQVEIRPEYRHSLFTSLDFDLRGEKEMLIPPRNTARQLLIFRVPRDLSAGGYYGLYEIEVYSMAGELLETHWVDLTAVIGVDYDLSAEIVDLTHSSGDQEDLFSLNVTNTGALHISPWARLQLLDEAGEIYANISLNLEGQDRFIPEESGLLLGERRGHITPGDYTASVVLGAGNQELAMQEFPLKITGDK